MASTQHSPEHATVVEQVLSMATAAAVSSALLVGERSQSLLEPLSEQGLEITTTDSSPPTGRQYDLVILLGLGQLSSSSPTLRSLRGVLSDQSMLIVSATNIGGEHVREALKDGSWHERPDSTDRLFSPETLRAELESAGLLIDTLVPVAHESTKDEDVFAFVARSTAHRAASQVAAARRRVKELASERDTAQGEALRLRTTVSEIEDGRLSLHSEVVTLNEQVQAYEASVAELRSQLADERASGLRDRIALRAELDRLRQRRALKVANRVGALVRRFR